MDYKYIPFYVQGNAINGFYYGQWNQIDVYKRQPSFNWKRYFKIPYNLLANYAYGT